MGYAISWLAIRGNSEAAVLAALGLEKTGDSEEIPESDWCSTRVGEWILIWSNSFEPSTFSEATAKLKGHVVICSIEEHVMFASATAFVDGLLRWRIVHDSQQAFDHLTVEGTPPESFLRIRAEESARAEGDRAVDFIFEIPVRMAQEVVGFRHDAESGAVFDVLRITSKPTRRWRFW